MKVVNKKVVTDSWWNAHVSISNENQNGYYYHGYVLTGVNTIPVSWKISGDCSVPGYNLSPKTMKMLNV